MQHNIETASTQTSQPFHYPVMLPEILELVGSLEKSNIAILDCTIGAGGHAEAILTALPQVRYIGLDADPEAIKRAGTRLSPYADRLTLINGYFDEVIARIAAQNDIHPDFILFDLGVSTHHYTESGRGFSFQQDEPLDMRLSPEADLSAADIINHFKEDEIADILYRYGEERHSRRIARALVEARKIAPIKTSARLAEIIAKSVPGDYRHGRIHPATRSFQALRIRVNNELERDSTALASALGLLAPGGILAVISFHSLEDRIVKQLFRQWSTERGYALIWKKPLSPREEEIIQNPPSRSAKLRAIRASVSEGGQG